MVSALGLAAAQSCGTRGTHASMACAYVPAIAAQAGFVAAMMARAGFDCGPAAVAGRNGVVEVIAPKADHAAICRDFGQALGSARQCLQAVSLRHRHPFGDRCVPRTGARAQADPDDIAERRVRRDPGALALCWRKLPDTELEAQVSLYHWLAAALVTARRRCRAGAAGLHPGSARASTSVAPQRHGQSRARDRSGQGYDADEGRHDAYGDHRARHRQPDQADVGRRAEREFLSQARGVLPDGKAKELLAAVMERARGWPTSRTSSRSGHWRDSKERHDDRACHRRSVLKAMAALPLGRGAPALRAERLPGPFDQADRAVSRGRRDRRRRARRRGAHVERARPADRDRQPARRRRDRRHQCGREGRSRRLHAADHDAGASDQHHAAEEAALRTRSRISSRSP